MNSFSVLRCYRVLLLIVLALAAGNAWTQPLRCGLALGFPPYQHQISGKPDGFDAQVVHLLFSKMGIELLLVQDNWDLVLNELRFGHLDLITGMEITPLRQRYFDFTMPYYERTGVLFVMANNPRIQQLSDLYGQRISGDRQTLLEAEWREQGIRERFRILKVDSKQEAMSLLKQGKIEGAIMPREVGIYLAKQLGVQVRELVRAKQGAPVALAVKKGNIQLLQRLDATLRQLIADGTIERTYQHWLHDESGR